MSSASRVVDLESTDASSLAGLDDLEQEIEGQPSYKLPKKFEGKSVEEVAQSFEELEKHSGQQSNEIGTLRREKAQLLNMNAPVAKAEEETLEPDVLLDNPSKAINNAIDSNPTVRALQHQLVTNELTSKRTGFEEKHPDWEDIVNSEGFKTFRAATPTRQKMWEAADQKFNYEVADELVSTYKEIHQKKSEQAADARKTKIAQGRDAAATVSSGSGLDEGRKNMLSRTYLQNLKAFHPEKYEMNKDQIMRAYAEGRVY